MKQGMLKANGISLGALEIDFMGKPGGSMKAKAAFVDTVTGLTHGWTTHEAWSPVVKQKLLEFREAIEADLAQAHFVGGEATTMGSGLAATSTQVSGPTGGLGEHLKGGEDAPQV